jgi:hypothetical protein
LETMEEIICRKLELRKIFTQLTTRCQSEEAAVNKWLDLKLAPKRIINSRVMVKIVLLVALVNITLKTLSTSSNNKNMRNKTKARLLK